MNGTSIQWPYSKAIFHLIFLAGTLAGIVAHAQATGATQPPSTSQSMQLPHQATPTTTLRHPGDIYKEAVHPLDVVRESMDNWSDPELGALAAGIRKAKNACAQANPQDYTGDDLYDLARLCALGQDWNATHDIAVKYIAGGDESHRARAYATNMNALIHLQDMDDAVEVAHEMLHKLPYDAVVAESVSYLTTYLQQSLNPRAIEVAVDHEPKLLEAFGSGVQLAELHGNDVMSRGLLYDSIMEVAFVQRYGGADQQADDTLSNLKLTLSKAETVVSSTIEDRLIMNAVDARYALLGSRIPEVEIYRSLLNPKSSQTTKPKINQAHGSLTVLLLFPEWCSQCRKMMKPLTALALAQSEAQTRAYGLMFQDSQSDIQQGSGQVAGKDPIVKAPVDQSFLDANDKELQGTPTLLVGPTTPRVFGAEEFPMGVVTDKDGKICFAGPLSSNAFDAHGFMEEILRRISSGEHILPQVDTKSEIPKSAN